MKAVVYDAGALVAADRNERRMWAEYRVRLEMGIVPSIPSPVVAQVSRAPKQAQLRRLLAGCEVVTFDERDAHDVGRMLGVSRTTDIVDGSVCLLAIRRRADIVTSHPDDIIALAAAANARLRLIDI